MYKVITGFILIFGCTGPFILTLYNTDHKIWASFFWAISTLWFYYTIAKRKS